MSEPKPIVIDPQAVMLREANHRVANSLQIANSIPLLHARTAATQEVRNELKEAAKRIQAIFLVHRRLYQSAEQGEADLRQYLQDLLAELAASYSDGDAGAEFK